MNLEKAQAPSYLKDLLILTGLYLIYFLFFLGSRHLSIPDEGRYPEIAREMLISGNWITPTINGVPFLDKPILYYWLEATSMHFFGVNNWAIRLPQAIFGIIGSLSIYAFGRYFFSRFAGLLASFILSVSILYFFAAHYANMDLIVANLLWISFFLFLVSFKESSPSKKKRFFMYGAYIIAALAFLTKGLMGIVFPAMVIFIWMLISNNFKRIKELYLPTGVILFLIIAAPWFILVQQQNPDFLYFFFYYQQFHRFVGEGFNNQLGPWFYFVIVFAAFLPFSILLLHRLLPGLRNLWINRKSDSITTLIMLWVVLIFIFFSIPSSKIVGYILPIIAPLALLMALSFEKLLKDVQVRRSFKVMHVFVSVIFAILTIGLLIYPFMQKKFDASLLIPSFYITAIATLSVTLSLILCFKNKLKKALILIIASMFLFNLAVLTVVPVFDQKTSKPLVEKILKDTPKDTVFISYNDYWEDLPVLLNQNIYLVYNWKTNTFKSDNWAREFHFGIGQYQKTHNGKWPKYLITLGDFKALIDSKKPVIIFMDQGKLNKIKNQFPNDKFIIKARYRDAIAVERIASN